MKFSIVFIFLGGLEIKGIISTKAKKLNCESQIVRVQGVSVMNVYQKFFLQIRIRTLPHITHFFSFLSSHFLFNRGKVPLVTVGLLDDQKLLWSPAAISVTSWGQWMPVGVLTGYLPWGSASSSRLPR